ncbi:transmembrane protein 179-like [Ostrea edulis]|uniref:transmembrane protein 179-like n=1 Tax=Ostrea edulis TaxID=37623 RepID=UPI002095B139|nr:transmembrane protein 179-like [Ostrea edulis]
MGMGNVLLLSQVIAFLVSFLGSFFIFIPMAMNLQEFDGHCLLGAKGFWNYSSATKTVILMDIEWGLHSDCGFSVFVGVIIMIASVFYIIWQSVYLFKNTDSSWLDAFVTCMISIIGCLLLFICSLVLSVGFNRWCHTLTKEGSPYNKCEDTEMNEVVIDSNISTRNMFSELNMAQFGSWLCWICWLVLSVLSVIKVYQYHKKDTFLSSMNRERQRLLQSVGHREPMVL